jgi:hypothetical protein
VVTSPPDPRQVFVVHGRNVPARDGLFSFLRAIGLQPMEWEEAVRLTGEGSPYIGHVLDVALNVAQAIVVLLTPDEITYLRSDYASEGDPDMEPAGQARPNVLFEAGMAIGRSQERTVLVELGTVRPFSDVVGRHAIRLDGSEGKRKTLADRLQTVGCAVDLSNERWITAGDLTPPTPPGAGLPLGRRVPSTGGPPAVAFDLQYFSRSKGGSLRLTNRGSETVFDVNFTLPDDIEGFQIGSGDLPLEKLPSGKHATFSVIRWMGRVRNNFDVHVTGRTAEGSEFNEEVFLSISD